MGCGKSKQAVATDNTTTVLKKSLSSLQSNKMETGVDHKEMEMEKEKEKVADQAVVQVPAGDGDQGNPADKNGEEVSAGGDHPVKIDQENAVSTKEGDGVVNGSVAKGKVEDKVKSEEVEKKDMEKEKELVSEESTNQEVVKKEEEDEEAKEETSAGAEEGKLVEDTKEHQKEINATTEIDKTKIKTTETKEVDTIATPTTNEVETTNTEETKTQSNSTEVSKGDEEPKKT